MRENTTWFSIINFEFVKFSLVQSSAYHVHLPILLDTYQNRRLRCCSSKLRTQSYPFFAMFGIGKCQGSVELCKQTCIIFKWHPLMRFVPIVGCSCIDDERHGELGGRFGRLAHYGFGDIDGRVHFRLVGLENQLVMHLKEHL